VVCVEVHGGGWAHLGVTRNFREGGVVPIYVYVCEDCERLVELRRLIVERDEKAPCPFCSAPMKRKLYNDVGYHFWSRWIPTKQGWVRGDM